MPWFSTVLTFVRLYLDYRQTCVLDFRPLLPSQFLPQQGNAAIRSFAHNADSYEHINPPGALRPWISAGTNRVCCFFAHLDARAISISPYRYLLSARSRVRQVV